jgi:dolichol-phosphate mannosyltransferase
VILVSYFSGIQLQSGIVGEYVARIYEEVAERPLYILESTLGFEDSLPALRRVDANTARADG